MSPSAARSSDTRSSDVRSNGTGSRPSQNYLRSMAIALVGAALPAVMLMPTDSVSVYVGESLPLNLLVLIAGLVMSLAGISILPWTRGKRWPGIVTGVALGLLLVSTMFAASRANGRFAWNGWWQCLSLLVWACMLWQVARNASLRTGLLHLLLLCGVYQSTLALHQYFVALPESRAAYLRDPDAELAKANIDAPPGSALRDQYENRLLGSFEPSGSYALANSLAVLLSGTIAALSVLLFSAAAAPSTVSASVKQKSAQPAGKSIYLLAAWIAWSLMVVAWLLTKSRSGYLAVIVTLAGVVLLWRFHRTRVRRLSASETTKESTGQNESRESHVSGSTTGRRWILFSVLLAGLAFGGLAWLLASDQLVLSEAPKSIAYRLEYWQAASRMILTYPLTGVGLGNFQSYYPQFKLATASEIVADPHNWLFDIAACCSPAFLLVIVYALVALVARSARHVWRGDIVERDALAAPSPFSSRGLWFGAALGCFVIASLQALMGQLINPVGSVISIFVTCLFAFGMHTNAAQSSSALRLAALMGALTMLVALLASGSWQASGICFPLVSMLAVAAVGVTDAEASSGIVTRGPTSPGNHLRTSSSNGSNSAVATHTEKSARISAVVMLCVLTVFMLQTWRPVQSNWIAQLQTQDAIQSGDLEAAKSLAAQAVTADPMNNESRRVLARVMVERALQSAPQGLEAFRKSCLQASEEIADWVAHDPISSVSASTAAEFMLDLAAACQSDWQELKHSLLEQASGFMQRATELYPSSVALHAQSAMVHDLLGQQQESRREADLSYELSESTPHVDRKLVKQQLYLPTPLARSYPEAVIQRPDSSRSNVSAEPFVAFLRSSRERE